MAGNWLVCAPPNHCLAVAGSAPPATTVGTGSVVEYHALTTDTCTPAHDPVTQKITTSQHQKGVIPNWYDSSFLSRTFLYGVGYAVPHTVGSRGVGYAVNVPATRVLSTDVAVNATARVAVAATLVAA